jgi:hypothetical protein
MFGRGVWGTRLGSEIPQIRHEGNTSPKSSILGCLGDAAGDAVSGAIHSIMHCPK